MYFLKLGLSALAFSVAVHCAMYVGMFSKALYMGRKSPAFPSMDPWQIVALMLFGWAAYHVHQNGLPKALQFHTKRPTRRAARHPQRRKLRRVA